MSAAALTGVVQLTHAAAESPTDLFSGTHNVSDSLSIQVELAVCFTCRLRESLVL